MAIDKELRIKIIQQKSGTAISEMKADIDVLEKSLLKIRIANIQLKKDYGASSQEFVNGKKLELRTVAELTAQKKLLATTEKLFASEVKKVNAEIRAEEKKSAQERKQIEKEAAEFRKKTEKDFPDFLAKNEAKATAYFKAESEKRVKQLLKELAEKTEAERKADQIRRSSPEYIAGKQKEIEATREEIRLKRELNRELERQRTAERVSLQFRPVKTDEKRDAKLTGQFTELGSLNALKQQIAYFKQQRDAVNTNTPAFKNLDDKVKSLTTSLKEQTGAGKQHTLSLSQLGANFTIIAAGAVTLIREIVRLGKATFEAAHEGAEFNILYENFVKVNGGIEAANKNLELFDKAATGNLNIEQLVKFSNGMTALGFASKDTAQLLDIAEKQGDKVGVVFEEANEKLQAFILTGAKKGLKDLKINIGTIEIAMEKVSGKTKEQINKLDALEQQTIRINAITSLYGSTVDEISQKTGDQADKINSLSKKYDNLVLLLKIGVASAFSVVTDKIDVGTDALQNNIDKVKYYGEQVGNVFNLLFKIAKLSTGFGFIEQFKGLRETGKLPGYEDIKESIEDITKLSADYNNQQLNQSTFAFKKIQEVQDKIELAKQKALLDSQKTPSGLADSKGGSKTKTKEKDPYEEENKAAQELVKTIENEVQLLDLKKSKYKDLNEILSVLVSKESLITKTGISQDNLISYYSLEKKLREDILAQSETEYTTQQKVVEELEKKLELNKNLPGVIREITKQLEEEQKKLKEMLEPFYLLNGKLPNLFDLSQNVQDIQSEEKTQFDKYKVIYRQSQDTLSNVSNLLTIFDVKTDSTIYKIVSGFEKVTKFMDTILNLLGSRTGSFLLDTFSTLLGFIPGVGPVASAATGAVGAGGGIGGDLPTFGGSETGRIVYNISTTPTHHNTVVDRVPYILKLKTSPTDLYYALEKVRGIEEGRTG